VLRACVAIERAGVPTVALVSNEFAVMATMIAGALGITGIPLSVYPGVIMTDSRATFDRNVVEHMVPTLFDGLLGNAIPAVAPVEASTPDYRPDRIVLTGGYDQILDGFTERNWTDGMPIVPPTPDRVAEFLRFTDRPHDEVLGLLLPASREATVWNVAVNGVLAGCRPEHLPILLAVVEAVADPVFRLEDAGSTPGWEPMVIVSGGIADRLGFNSGVGALRVGNRANTSIGRFLRLYMRNVAGLLPEPDETDKGAIGSTFNVALAESEQAVRDVGWQPHRVDRGFGDDDDVVTVRGVYASSAPIYSAGEHAEDHLYVIAKLLTDTLGPWTYNTYIYQHQHPLVVLGPAIARIIAEEGLTKDDVRSYLFEHVRVDGAWVAHYGRGVSGKRYEWAELAAAGKVPTGYADAEATHQQVRGLLRPEWTDIVVAGNPGRNQSRAYVNNHGQGVPVSKRVELPAHWDRLLER
jgi:hypothetical protein